MDHRLALCLEQTLGHRSHSQNLEAALTRAAANAHILPVEYSSTSLRVPWAVAGSISAHKRLRRLMENDPRIDAVFYHTQTISLLAPWTTSTPYVVSVDATPFQLDRMASWYSHQVRPRIIERVKASWYRRVFANASAIVAWSQWAGDSLIDDYSVDASKITVLHPGAPEYLFQIDRTYPQRKPRILFVGGDLKRKGGDLLLKAFAHLDDQAELTLMTETELTPGPGIRVLSGVRPGTRAFVEAFAEADLFCLPTRGDCTPVALGEALAAGLPVITTRIGSNEETVRDGETGMLVSPDSIDDLHDALARLVGDAALRHEMSQRARADAMERFAAERNAGRIFQLMVEVAA